MDKFKAVRIMRKLDRLLADQYLDDLVEVASTAYAKHQNDIVECAQKARYDVYVILERLQRTLGQR